MSLLRIVLIDNYDSFTYNLVHYIEEINGIKPIVYRNDDEFMPELSRADLIVLSPGPGLPKEAGKLMSIIDHYHASKAILGVCLGHQAIGEYFGSKLINLQKVHHGVSSEITGIDNDLMHIKGEKLQVGRYHSWAIDHRSLSGDLLITSVDNNDVIMSIKHRSLPIYGIQYHPESVLTPNGKELLDRFIKSMKQTKN